MPQNRMDNLKYLKIHSWRENLSEAATLDLESQLQARNLITGETLYFVGEEANHGYQIASGEMSIVSHSSDGRELALGSFPAGYSIGDTALVNGGHRYNNAVATCNTVVMALSRKDYKGLCLRHPEIAMRMSELMGYRFQFMYSLIQDACLLPLYHRLGRILIRMSMTKGRAANQKFFTIEDCSQEKLGHMVGAARQSIGREMKKMENEGLIRIEYKSVTVVDFDTMFKTFGELVDYEPMTNDFFEYHIS